MISTWKAELQDHGFEYKKWSPSEKAYVKHIGNVELQIWEQSVRQRPGDIFINTYISIADPFSTGHKYLVVLNGRLATNGIVIPRSDTGVGRFWKGEEAAEALGLLRKLALPWFEENSSLDKLIAHVTNDVVIKPRSTGKQSWIFSELVLSKLLHRKNVEIKTPPISYLKLSLLFYHAGKIDLACLNAKEWLKTCGNLPNEPDRTLRQLIGMGCSDTGSGPHST